MPPVSGFRNSFWLCSSVSRHFLHYQSKDCCLFKIVYTLKRFITLLVHLVGHFITSYQVWQANTSDIIFYCIMTLLSLASSFCSSFHVIEVQSKQLKFLTVDNWHWLFGLNTVLFRFLVLVFWHTLILQDIKIFTNFYSRIQMTSLCTKMIINVVFASL